MIFLKSFLFALILILFACGNQHTEKDESKPISTKESGISKPDSVTFINIKRHVDVLCNTSKPRNYQNIEILDSVALYIENQLSMFADTVYYQDFMVDGKRYRNVVAALNYKAEERIIIGAHYDVHGDFQGADDNASGVAGLIEVGRQLSKKQLENRVDLVAFTLEEPPFFRSSKMGSYQYAAYLKKNKIDVKYMVCLEMIGYFDDQENTQEYPIAGLEQKFGTKGNFLAIVENENQGGVGNAFFEKLNKNSNVIYQYLNAPSSLTGIDFSDHLSFWKKKIKAFMITDTSFYRNKNYHTKSDTPSKLNYNKIAYFVMDFVNAF